jgi:hypothetical protein
MKLHPDTPVMVEWWVHTRIPSVHYAVVCPYAQALAWHNRGLPISCFTIDADLFEELFHERNSKTAG